MLFSRRAANSESALDIHIMIPYLFSRSFCGRLIFVIIAFPERGENPEAAEKLKERKEDNLNYSDKPTKKQIRDMKALYTEKDVKRMEKQIDEQVQIIHEVVDTNGDPMRAGRAMTAIFELSLNETSRMLGTFDEKAFVKALSAGSSFTPDSVKEGDPMTELFKRMNTASQDFAFGHAYAHVNKVLDNATEWVSHFMYSHPEFNDALEMAWQEARKKQEEARAAQAGSES